MYLVVHSTDSKSLYPHNTPWNFSLSLAPLPNFNEEEWECALVDFRLKDVKVLEEDLYVYCDLLEYNTLVNDRLMPLLRLVGEQGEVGYPYYVPLHRVRACPSVHFDISTKKGQEPSVQCEEVRCTLHLRRKI